MKTTKKKEHFDGGNRKGALIQEKKRGGVGDDDVYSIWSGKHAWNALVKCIASESCGLTSPPWRRDEHYRYYPLHMIKGHKRQAAKSAIIASPMLGMNMASYVRFVNRNK